MQRISTFYLKLPSGEERYFPSLELKMSPSKRCIPQNFPSFQSWFKIHLFFLIRSTSTLRWTRSKVLHAPNMSTAETCCSISNHARWQLFQRVGINWRTVVEEYIVWSVSIPSLTRWHSDTHLNKTFTQARIWGTRIAIFVKMYCQIYVHVYISACADSYVCRQLQI